GHGVKLLKQARLIIHKALKEVFTQAHIHARFPVIEAAALQYTRYEVLDTYAQVEDSIRFQRQPINGANPTGIGTTYNGTSHEGINIAVGEYDKACPQGRENLTLKAVYKVGGVEKVERDWTKRVPLFCLFETSSHQL